MEYIKLETTSDRVFGEKELIDSIKDYGNMGYQCCGFTKEIHQNSYLIIYQRPKTERSKV